MIHGHRRRIGIQCEGVENIFNKIIAENFPNHGEVLVIQVQEAFRKLKRQDKKITSLDHIIDKTLSIQNKERVLKATREKCKVTYNRNP
jgi:ABC-type lipopolysaccharide export system ATPase subunit